MAPDCFCYCQGETITDTWFTARSVTIITSHASHKGTAMEPERSVMFSSNRSQYGRCTTCSPW
jgi:hypothetical protein